MLTKHQRLLVIITKSKNMVCQVELLIVCLGIHFTHIGRYYKRQSVMYISEICQVMQNNC